jgi:hypothetical protein
MDDIRKSEAFVRRALMIALVLGVVISPFFYHLISFLFLPVLIPIGIIFVFVYFTGLTDFERRKMIILNIIFSISVIALYEGYLIFIVAGAEHVDIHLNVTIWFVQILAVNLLLVFVPEHKEPQKIKKRKRIRKGVRYHNGLITMAW